jgi:hypothetical protein
MPVAVQQGALIMERIRANYSLVKKLGHWTTAQILDVRARRGAAVLDLRSSRIPEGDVEVQLTVDGGMVKLLVPDGAVIDTDNLKWLGRGRVKDWTGVPSTDGRRIRLTGAVRDGEVRIHRGGIAILSALLSRAFLDDCIQAHRTGTEPTVLDPGATR